MHLQVQKVKNNIKIFKTQHPKRTLQCLILQGQSPFSISLRALQGQTEPSNLHRTFDHMALVSDHNVQSLQGQTVNRAATVRN